MSGGQAKSIEHPRAQILIMSGLLSIDTLIYVGLDQGAFVISSYIAYYLDGYNSRTVIAGNVVAEAVMLMITSMSRGRHSIAATASSTHPFSDFLTLHHPPERAHAHVAYYAILILPTMDQRSGLTKIMSDGIITR
jgi:hypothetical protein